MHDLGNLAGRRTLGELARRSRLISMSTRTSRGLTGLSLAPSASQEPLSLPGCLVAQEQATCF